MKIAVYSDVHWSQNSSIVRGRGLTYSVRLHNLIESVNWAERLAWDTGCSSIICCGDFFDSATLNSEEISALKNIQWAPLPHVFLTGNHEVNVSSLEYSTADLFQLAPNSTVINHFQQFVLEGTDTEICFLPYFLERDRLSSIGEYFPEKLASRRIIFSHNDIKDIQYGPFLSIEGFSVDDIHNNCDLFINGHIHHAQKVTDKIYHPGNLTGQNFTEDAEHCDHVMLVIDTDTLHVEWYGNPHAFNFYKIDTTSKTSIEDLSRTLESLKPNSVITLKVTDKMNTIIRDLVDSNTNIIASRLIVEYQSDITNDKLETFESVDHLQQFENYVLTEIGSADIIKDELSQILTGA